MRALPVALGVLVYASAAAAQERSLTSFDLPRDVERRLSIIVNDPGTRRFSGSAVIPPGEFVAANVVAYDGPLTVAGRIQGELIVLGGSVDFEAGSQVTGDVTVVGGEARNVELASIGGTITTYSEGFELYHRGERILAVNTRNRRRRTRSEDFDRWGRSSFVVRTATNYNRVEGLPVMFGPVIETGGSSPTRLEALGILRTEGDDIFDTRSMGYVLRAEQFLGGRTFRVGGSAFSLVNAIESWNLSDLEASLATFLLHDDQRDYYEREGFAAYARLSPREVPFDLTVGYWDEEYGSRAALDPWTLFGDGGWRAQPLVAEGRLRSIAGRLEIDARNDDDFATSGILIRAEARHGIDGSLQLPARALFGEDPPSFTPAEPLNERFNHGLLDVRIYRRVGFDATLALRGVAGGSLDGKAIPPQFQHALGGAGTLPGYRLFRGDCGARTLFVQREGSANQRYFPRYGCDRFAMGSIEYRGGFDFDFGGDWDFWGHGDDDWNWHVDASPNWMVFFNAGQGWALDESRSLGARNTEVLYDAGAGIMLGDFGIFGAVPLTGENRSVKFFVRLGARF